MTDFRIGYGQIPNYFKKLTVTRTVFGDLNDGYRQDALFPFTTQGLMFLNEDTMNIVEFSFNGFDVHGELNPTLPSRGLSFDSMAVSKVWFRIKSGSSGPVTVDVMAWGIY